MIRESERTQPKVMAFATNRKEQKRFVKFAVVGLIGAMVDLTVLNFLVFVVGLDQLWANPISVFCAIISNFIWNRFWSFPESRQRPLVSQFVKFAGINMIGLLINQTIFWLLSHYVMPPLGFGEWLTLNLSKATAIGLVLFWNFGVNRLTTYKGL